MNDVARQSHLRRSATVRWIAISIFVFSGILNYFDRQILATIGVSFSFFCFNAWSANTYSIPLRRLISAVSTDEPVMRPVPALAAISVKAS